MTLTTGPHGAMAEGRAGAAPAIAGLPAAYRADNDIVRIRTAGPGDREALRWMQALTTRVLGRTHYSSAEIESFLTHVGTMDDVLLEEGTYFLAEVCGFVVGSGGWSARAPGYDRLLPADGTPHIGHTAQIRSVFVHPHWGRRGIARRILATAEADARAAGHGEIELTAMLSGVGFYRALGYETLGEAVLTFPDGCRMRGLRMRKRLVPAEG